MSTVFKLANGNVYSPNNRLAGRASEVDFGELPVNFSDYKGLGMLGDMEIPNGFGKIEAKVKFNTFFRDEMGVSPTKATTLIFRGNSEGYEGQGKVSDTGIIITMTGVPKNFPLGSFKGNEMSNLELKYSVYSVKVTVGGQDLWEYDVMSNTFKVKGVDQNAAWKLNT